MANRLTTYRALICTALPVEYMAVRAHLQNLQEIVHEEGTVYERGEFTTDQGSWMVSIVEIGPGNTSTALETERAIQIFRPEIVFFVGVAGGLKDVRLGDIVVATKVYDYESAKDGTELLLRPEVGNSTHRMVQRARAEARKPAWLQRVASVPTSTPRVLVGPIAAGGKVVSSSSSATWKLIRKAFNDALAVEMEGSGFLRTAHANHTVEALIVRGISDLIDNKQEADSQNFQKIASEHASAFAFEVLSKLPASEARAETASQERTSPPSGSKYNPVFNGPVGNVIQGDGHHINIHQTNKEEP